MEEKKELEDTQKILAGEGEPKTPTLTEEEIADLKRKAEVSSQNFERAKKAEAKLKELEELRQQTVFTDGDYSDEGRALKSEILALREEITSFKKAKEEESVFSRYPKLKDKESEFREYVESPDNKGIPLDKVAKLFIVENSLTESEAPKRQGLEKPTSGAKSNVKKGWTSEEVKRLRETQPRKYEMMIRDGRLNPDEIVD